MQAVKKAQDNEIYGHAVINSKVKSYTNDPFFVKKAVEAKATIRKVGLPGAKKK